MNIHMGIVDFSFNKHLQRRVLDSFTIFFFFAFQSDFLLVIFIKIYSAYIYSLISSLKGHDR